jgi:hypothetical protein
MFFKQFGKTLLTKRIKLACFIVCGVLTVFFLLQYSDERKTSLHYLDKDGELHTLYLPVKDKEKLLLLMQKLFAEDSFAYTVLGSKPISWITYQKHLPFANWRWFYYSFSDYNIILGSGWDVWEKYCHLFPSAHLFAEHPRVHPGSVSILIVNEDNFNEAVKNNKQDFEKVLRREIKDGSQLLIEAKNRSLMNEVLEGHQALLGIALGYGRENSWNFFEGCKKRIPIGCVWGEDDPVIYEDSEISTTDFYLSAYSCPSFAGNPNSLESLVLKEDYLQTKKKVLNYYAGKDFLEATLSLLAGYRPID